MHFLPTLAHFPASSCATLPSSTAVADLLQGKPGAITHVVLSTALRAALIAAGLYTIGGIRDQRTLVRGSIGAALAIEVFVFFWVWQNMNRDATPHIAENEIEENE